MEDQIISLVDDFIDTMIEIHNLGPEQEQGLYEIAEKQLLELTDKALFLLGGREEYLEAMLKQLISQKLPQGAVMDCFGNFNESLDEIIANVIEVYHGMQSTAFPSTDQEVLEEEEVEESEEEPLDEFSEKEEIEIEETDTLVGSEEENKEEFEVESEESDVEGDLVQVTEEDIEEDSESEVVLEDPHEGESPKEQLGEEISDDPMGILIEMAFSGEEIIQRYEIADMVFDYFLPQHSLAFLRAREEKESISHIGALALRKAGISVVRVNPENIYNSKAFKRKLKRLLLEKSSEEKRIFDLSAE